MTCKHCKRNITHLHIEFHRTAFILNLHKASPKCSVVKYITSSNTCCDLLFRRNNLEARTEIYIKKVANRVCYTIYNSRTTQPILIIFSFFGFVSAPNNRITIKKIGKVNKKNKVFPEKEVLFNSDRFNSNRYSRNSN